MTEPADKPTDTKLFLWQGHSIGTALEEARALFELKYGYPALAVWHDDGGHVFAGPVREGKSQCLDILVHRKEKCKC